MTPPVTPPQLGPQNFDPEADAAALRRELQGEWPAVAAGARPALIVLCGLPGTGKSYFAAALARRAAVVILSSDRIRKILVAEPRYSRGEHRRVFAAAHLLLAELLGAGYAVVFDATNRTERARQPLYAIAESAGARLVILEFDVPEEVARRRLEGRAAGAAAGYVDYSDADWRIYCQMRQGGEPIRRPHWRVDSTGDIGPVVERVAGLAGG